MPFTYEKVEEAKQGNSLVSTLDSYVQYVCEKYLDAAVEENHIAERGAVIAMNVNTGAILGMAISGDFNPNSPFTLSAADQKKVDAQSNKDKKAQLKRELLNRQWRNKAVSDTYDAFLKSYDQELGRETYGACVDLLVEYYRQIW